MPDKRIERVEPNAVMTLAELVQELHALQLDVADYNKSQAEEQNLYKKEQRKRDRIIIGALVAVMIFLIGGIVVSRQVNALNRRIADCIETSGKCYQSGARRTGGAVQFIGQDTKNSVVAANWCATQRLGTLVEFQKCVDSARAILAKSK